MEDKIMSVHKDRVKTISLRLQRDNPIFQELIEQCENKEIIQVDKNIYQKPSEALRTLMMYGLEEAKRRVYGEEGKSIQPRRQGAESESQNSGEKDPDEEASKFGGYSI